MRIKSKTTFNFENNPNKIFVEGLTFKETVRYAYHLLKHFNGRVYPARCCVVAPDGNGGIMEIS